MLICNDAEPLILHRVEGSLSAELEVELARHLEGCARCRQVLDDQRAIARFLASRPQPAPDASFAVRLSQRLDAETSWLDVANWRAWTVRLAPVAAGLLVAAALTIEPAAPGDGIDLSEVAETWAVGTEQDVLPTTALFWQADVSDDSLLEVILTSQPDDPLDGADYDQ